MKKELITVPIGHLQLNTGQCAPQLPRNPRCWTPTDLERMKASIQEDPDWMDGPKAPEAVPHPKKPNTFVTFCGNLRTQACQHLFPKEQGVNVWVSYPESDEDWETVRRRTIKDNGTFGAHDWEALANGEWGTEEDLEAWGIPTWQAPHDEVAEYEPKGVGEVKLDGNEIHYAITVRFDRMEEQLALLKELKERGYDVSGA